MIYNQLQARFERVPPGRYDRIRLTAVLLVDGKPLVDFGYYTVDVDALSQSIQVSGTFDILTCDCGVAGCAGLNSGIHIEHEGNQIRWNLTEPLPARSFTFEQGQYQHAVYQLQKAIFHLIEKEYDLDEYGDSLLVPFDWTEWAFLQKWLDQRIQKMKTDEIPE